MFMKIREWGRNFQAKYENMISGKNLCGFTDVYVKAMREIKQKNEKLHKEAS